MLDCLQPFESRLFLQIFLKTEATVDGFEASQLLLTLPEGSTMGDRRRGLLVPLLPADTIFLSKLRRGYEG